MNARRRPKKSTLIRWLAGGLAALVLLLAALAVTVPLAVSTDLVRDRLERDISAWTGHTVELGSNPQITFLPVPQITLKNVSIRSRRLPQAERLAFADSVSADFSIISALRGNPDFSNFRFVRPIFVIERFAGNGLSWTSNAGRIAEAVAVARQNAEAVAEGGTAPRRLPSNQLGEIEIVDGTVRWIDRQSGREEVVSAIHGRIDWGRIDTGVSMALEGILRGAAVRIEAASRQPLLIFAGETAPFTFRLSGSPLTLSFEGTANLSRALFFGGELSLTVPSTRQAMEWSGTRIIPGEALGALEVEATVTTQNDRASFDDLILEVDGNRGIGVLDLQMSETGVPVLAGTLAFSTLDIGSFLRAFTPLPRSSEEIATTIDTRFLRQLGLDLRLSAQTARLGPLTLGNLAAAARIDEERAVFEVGDASAYGGTLTAKLEIAERGLEGGGALTVSVREAEFGRVFDAFEMAGPLPRGVGSLDVALRSTQPLWATGPRDVQGNVALSLVDGAVPALDLEAFRALSAENRFFDLGRVGGDSLTFSSARFEADVADGLAELHRGEIVSQRATIRLSGIVPYAKGSLAMAGTLGPPPAEEGAGPAPRGPRAEDGVLSFFVGGSWPSPVISPIVSPPAGDARE